MKTPKEWSDQIRKTQTRMPIAQIVAQIQTDTLEYALQIALAYESQTGRFIAKTIQNKISELNPGK